MSKNNTLALIETRGMTALTSAIDSMLKGSNIKMLGFKGCGSAYLTAAFKGSDDDVLNAIEIGKNAVNQIAKKIPSSTIVEEGLSQLITAHSISNPMLDFVDIFFNKKKVKLMEKGKAIAFIDARGLVSLIAAADIMSKTSAIDINSIYSMGSGRLSLLISGDIEALNCAIEAGIKIVKKHGQFISHCVIARPDASLISSLLKNYTKA
ncbi:BMC domain-containing protein [Natronospora cellulosivora (SeqCode)]